jgi:hypothetical protein
MPAAGRYKITEDRRTAVVPCGCEVNDRSASLKSGLDSEVSVLHLAKIGSNASNWHNVSDVCKAQLQA